MSHNPNTIKSQDDTTEDELGRTMTLLRAIEQLEKTECKLERVEKQLYIAKESISSALNFLACPDRISETECNEQLAFDELRKTLEELNK